MRKIVGAIVALILLNVTASGQDAGSLERLCERYEAENSDATYIKVSQSMLAVAKVGMSRESRKLVKAMNIKGMYIFSMKDSRSFPVSRFFEEAESVFSKSSFISLPQDEKMQKDGLHIYYLASGGRITNLFLLVAKDGECSLTGIKVDMDPATAVSSLQLLD